VICGVEIGEWAFVAAGSVVTRSARPTRWVIGVPARRVGWVCRCGVRLALGPEAPVCEACGLRYRFSPATGLLTLEDDEPSAEK